MLEIKTDLSGTLVLFTLFLFTRRNVFCYEKTEEIVCDIGIKGHSVFISEGPFTLCMRQ